MDRERKHKRELERQLKDVTKQAEDLRLLLKSGEMSQDELKKKFAELTRKLNHAEDALRDEKKLTEEIKKEC